MKTQLKQLRINSRHLLGLIIALGLAFLAGAAALRAAPAGATNLERRLAAIVNAVELNTDIDAANAATSGTHTILFAGDITLPADSTPINLQPGVTLIIDGNGHTLDGASTYRGFTILGGTVEIQNLTISNGYGSSAGGGGIWMSGGTLTVTNSTFANNSAGFNQDGGGLWTNSTMMVANSTFFNNSASSGGGLWTNSTNSTMTVADSTFSGNSASTGGGLWTNSTNSTMTVSNSTFSGNSVSTGGGIWMSGGTLTVANSTFSGNSASTGGGGLYVYGGTLNLVNTILANSTSSEDCYNTGIIWTNANNLIEVQSGCGTPFLSVDPVLGPLQDNGGPTYTHALLPGSPAIDAGDNSACAVSPVNGLDQRGWTRPIDGDLNGTATCDIGAYEKTIDLFLPLIMR